MIVVRPATLEDAVWLSSRLRSEDVREVETATGRSPLEVVPESFGISSECYTIRQVEGANACSAPIALFGVSTCPADTDLGAVWLLGTRKMRLNALSIVREAPLWLDHMSRRYAKGLYNFADLRNELHVRWCHLTGFELRETIDINGSPFQLIYRPQCVTP
jgi:hypothetical protein